MALDLVIKNGKIVTPTHSFSGAVAIDKGKIVAVGDPGLVGEATRTIDATGKYVLPGIVDPHFHMNFLETFEYSTTAETRAAAAGGVTTIGLFILMTAGEGIVKGIKTHIPLYEANAVVDAFFHPLMIDPLAVEEISAAPSLGITSFKFSLGYKGAQAAMIKAVPIEDGQFFEGLEKIARIKGGRATVHTENIDIALRLRERLKKQGRTDMAAWNDAAPPFVEAECMKKCIYLAQVTGCPLYIVHMTIGEGVDIVAEAKSEGVDVVAETCPQYLTHNSEEPAPIFKEQPALANVNPPLRDKWSNEKLWQGIKDGIVTCIGSDQSPQTRGQKGNDIWSAPMGLGNMTEMILPVMLNEGVKKGRIPLEKVVELCCQNPAKAFGVYPRKGAIALGSDADIVIVDPNKKVKVTPEILHSACDWTLYEGWEFTGWPVMTILRGEIIAQDGKILAPAGYGRYVPREV